MQLLTHSAHQGTRAEGPRDAVLSTGSAADQARSADYDGNGLQGRPVYHCKRGASEADQTIVFAALAASRRIEDQPAGQSGNRRYRTMPSWEAKTHRSTATSQRVCRSKPVDSD